MTIPDAVKHLERARALLADLDRVRNPVDLQQVRAGAQQEVSDALSALQETVTGERPGKVRRDARATSERAARGITVKSGTQRARVLVALAEQPLTDHELSTRLRILPSSLRPRRGELVDLYYVQPDTRDGVTRTRMHGSDQWTVWTVTAAGLALARSLGADMPPREPGEPGQQLALGQA